MAEKKNILTEEGLAKLEDELQDLKVNRRKEVAAKMLMLMRSTLVLQFASKIFLPEKRCSIRS